MSDLNVEQIAMLLRERNGIDAKIAAIIQRPMTAGHLGEWIAARIFGVELEASAVTAAIDGRFASGPLRGRTVNVKWYPKREGLLDVTEAPAPDYPAFEPRSGQRPRFTRVRVTRCFLWPRSRRRCCAFSHFDEQSSVADRTQWRS